MECVRKLLESENELEISSQLKVHAGYPWRWFDCKNENNHLDALTKVESKSLIHKVELCTHAC